MTDSLPVVLTVVTRDHTVFIEFEDGHGAVFDGYPEGIGDEIEDLHKFTLHFGDAQVAQYQGRLADPSRRTEQRCFIQVAEGYSAKRIASYWEAAKTHVRKKYLEQPRDEGLPNPSILRAAWLITSQGRMDLDCIEEGRIPLPEPSVVPI